MKEGNTTDVLSACGKNKDQSTNCNDNTTFSKFKLFFIFKIPGLAYNKNKECELCFTYCSDPYFHTFFNCRAVMHRFNLNTILDSLQLSGGQRFDWTMEDAYQLVRRKDNITTLVSLVFHQIWKFYCKSYFGGTPLHDNNLLSNESIINEYIQHLSVMKLIINNSIRNNNNILLAIIYNIKHELAEMQLYQTPVEEEQKGELENIGDTDFQDESLINFNRIYILYYECLEKRNDCLRSKCVKFFVEYHRYKFIHYFDVQGYIKFILDVFFDPSFEVFNNMLHFECRFHKPTIQHIYKRIINDKRNIDNQNTVQEQMYQKGEIQLDKNINTNTSSAIVNNQESRCILPDILLERIISFSLDNLPTFDISQVDLEIVLNIALVSKKLFKIVSKYISNGYYLRGPIKLQSEYCNINSPLHFDYDSIKYIKYGESSDRINQLFSRVKEFSFVYDEFDCSSSKDRKRYYIIRESEGYYEEDIYNKAIKCQEYLTSLPAMPNLKSITVTSYFGYRTNYSSFLSSILTNTPNGNGHGIESFKIAIDKDWTHGQGYSHLDFLEPLLRLHSNTLKSIEIKYLRFCHDEDMKALLQILAPTLEHQNFSFILYADFRMLKRVCQVDQDRKVYQYLLNQKIQNNIPYEDYDDNSDYDQDEEDYDNE
ncbi:hypothetical protein PPL_05167 [Heterostelium album PN500]|uniref:F-box domain-containing protein n=1 Tax=Heterostelium pallidum (strain ATCC 26659 / Pp 5 / PN500) TaxID=670386 RepID=D3B9M3_HETP5|nr:hypothetical protein PPL_05167 [Heterostelium album PN500]EFA81935.1 hypothetical protein PPL_05167 [Heterostelium album PN500]|eukprot:XP_020434052.1 hypothetical protein PPL_05167 [Heterostelium album PN500]